MNKMNIYLAGLAIAIAITGFISVYSGCIFLATLVFTTDSSDLCSVYIDLKRFIRFLPWVMLGVYIPITAVIFYLSGARKKKSIEIKPRETENESN